MQGGDLPDVTLPLRASLRGRLKEFRLDLQAQRRTPQLET